MKKVAFITGAGGYIGGETAKVLAAEGISVAVCDLIPERVEQTVATIVEAGGSAKGYVADVTESASITAAIEQAAADFGRLDIMVHAAGGSSRIAGPEAKYVHLVDQEDWVIDRVLKVNLYGAFYADRAAARIMIRQGQGGKIINFGSTVGINGLCYCADYAAAKGGIMSLTKTLAKELGPHKINVVCVAPGVVARPDEEHNDTYKHNTNFLNEQCTATDIADLIAFLVSDKNRFITGQTYVVDGGRSLAMKGSE
jgi:NAD(P)-dependent dehydrogenase (short-subunit alcohol dehydrogenase family)